MTYQPWDPTLPLCHGPEGTVALLKDPMIALLVVPVRGLVPSSDIVKFFPFLPLIEGLVD